MSNAITNNFIYQFLLPLIVLSEGFNMRRRSLNVYGKEVAYIGVIVPLLTVILNAIALVALNYCAHKYLDLSNYSVLRNDLIVSIAIVMCTVELHGSIAPLHSIVNMRLYKIMFSSCTFNNNISLVLVMTFERMIQNESTTS